MHLLNVNTHQLEYFEGSDVPPYAILSHRWEKGEVLFKEVQKGRQAQWPGWKKILLCCQQALKDGYNYVWVDTCCIDKRSSAELSEAINSMYNWYKEAQVCYVYLSDVSVTCDPVTAGVQPSQTHADFTESIWFSRGWTLQELLAPKHVLFYDRSWTRIGSKVDHATVIEAKTLIGTDVLRDGNLIHVQSVIMRMSWAASRTTTRVEDRAYCLLGLFNVNMPLLYGERDQSFQRLLKEIAASSNDTSIFAASRWFPGIREVPMFPASLDCFQDLPLDQTIRALSSGKYTISKGRVELSGQYLLPYKLDYHVWMVACGIHKHAYPISVEFWFALLQRCEYSDTGPPIYRRVLLDGQALVKSYRRDLRDLTLCSASISSAIIETPSESSKSLSPLQYSLPVGGAQFPTGAADLRCWPVVVRNSRYHGSERNHSVTISQTAESVQTTLWHFDSGQRWNSLPSGSDFALLVAFKSGTAATGQYVLVLLCAAYNALREPVCFVKELGRSYQREHWDELLQIGFIEHEDLGKFELLSRLRRCQQSGICERNCPPIGSKEERERHRQRRLLLKTEHRATGPSIYPTTSTFAFGELFDIHIAEQNVHEGVEMVPNFVTTFEFHVPCEGENLPGTWHRTWRSRMQYHTPVYEYFTPVYEYLVKLEDVPVSDRTNLDAHVE